MSLNSIIVITGYTSFLIICLCFLSKIIIQNKGNRLFFYGLNFMILPSIILIILKRDKFTVTGWTAIGEFDFSLLAFIEAVNIHAFILLSIMLAYGSLIILPRVQRRFVSTRQLTHLPRRKSTNTALFGFLLIILMISCYGVSAHKIGVTGAQPGYLPFKLVGVIYYTMRVILPVVLFYYFYRFRVSGLNLSIIIGAVLSLSILTMSKYQTSIMFISILLPSIRDQKYVRSIIIATFTMLTLQLVPVLRQISFLIRSNTAVLSEESLYERLIHATSLISVQEVWLVLFSISSRVSSVRSTILGMQVENLNGIPVINLLPILSYFGSKASELTYLTNGFIPPRGFATGVDNLGLLVISLHNLPVIYCLSLYWICLVIKFHERLASNVTRDPYINTVIVFVLAVSAISLSPTIWFFALMCTLILDLKQRTKFS